jgi:hypothetical protein
VVVSGVVPKEKAWAGTNRNTQKKERSIQTVRHIGFLNSKGVPAVLI